MTGEKFQRHDLEEDEVPAAENVRLENGCTNIYMISTKHDSLLGKFKKSRIF